MIQAKIINKINFPEIKMQSTLEEIADRVIIRDIIAGISSRQAIMGGALPRNDRQTVLRKGKDTPLIDTGELINSFSYRPAGKDKVLIYIDSGRKDVARYLQIDGINTLSGKKYYKFFGISQDAYRRSIQYASNKVKELTTSGKRSGGK